MSSEDVEEIKEKYDIKTLDDVLKIVARWALDTRKLVRILIVSFIVDIILTVTIGYGVNYLHSNTQHEQLISCVDGNRLRANEKQLWNFIFNKIEAPHPTVKQREGIQVFRDEVNRAMKLRDCRALYG